MWTALVLKTSLIVYKSVCYLTFDLSRDFPDEFMISDSNGTIIQKSRVKKGIKAGRI